MFNHRTGGYEKKDKDGNPTGKYTNAQDNYTCSTYSKAKGKFENRCTQHHVRTDVIRDLLLEVIKATGDRIQQIDIYLKYVGRLDVPMPELTPEQIKEEERKRRKRAWGRTYWRRRKEREQAEQEAKERELSEAVG